MSSSGDWPFDDAPGSAPRALSGAGPLDEAEPAGASGPFGLPPEARYAEGGLLGRGGMGEVRCAADQRLGREVAVKRARADHQALIREAQLTARLEHPGIVPVYGAGKDAEGRPYYTMPVVRGRSLAEAIRAAPDLPARLRLLRHVLDACQAVAYAHSQGVLHRDLKPANIMVGEFGETLVADWGLATPLEQARGGVGTAEYAAPEQLRGEALDRRADVFALGGVLYELLAGQAPRAGPEAPLRPLPAGAPPELNAIAGKALSIEASARYSDASELAAELEAWFEGRRVAAHDYSAWELLQRLLRAWRVPLGVGAVALVALGVSVTVGYLRTAEERDRAREAEQAAVEARRQSDESLAVALVAQALEAAARGERAAAEVLASGALAIQESPDARGVLSRFGGRDRPERIFHAPMPACDRTTLSHDTERVACSTEEAVLLLRPGEPPYARYETYGSYVALAEGGAYIMATDGRLSVTEGESGLYELPDSLGNVRRPIGGLGEDMVIVGSGEVWRHGRSGAGTRLVEERAQQAWVSPEGEVLIATWGGELLLWRDGEVRRRVPAHVPFVMTLALSSAGPPRAVVGSVDGQIKVIDLESGEVRFEASIGSDTAADIALWEDHLAVSMTSGGVQVWDLAHGARVAQLPSTLAAIGWREDGRVLRVVSSAVEDWRLPEEVWPHRHVFASGVASVDVSPDGRLLAAGLGSGALPLQRMVDGTQLMDLGWSDAVVKGVAFSPDGRRVVGASAGGPAHVFTLPGGALERVLGEVGDRRVSWLDAATVLFAPYAMRIDGWRLSDDPPTRYSIPLDRRPGVLKARDGRMVFLDQRGGLSWIDDPEQGLIPMTTDETAVAVDRHRDGAVIAHAEAYVIRGADGAEHLVPAPGPRIMEIASSPDGRWIALGHLDGTATLWSAQDDRKVAVLRGHGARVVSVVFSQDGRWLVTGSWDGEARVWALAPLSMPAAALQGVTESAWGRDVAGILGG
ncbi:MAG: protein kinase [Alphaproteobacteria bacterium]|nr:protein kinase [Alphaproteobacteria bacterium]MCB9791521.1 protein kinase [Alphaproteobacteria bacterium]